MNEMAFDDHDQRREMDSRNGISLQNLRYAMGRAVVSLLHLSRFSPD